MNLRRILPIAAILLISGCIDAPADRSVDDYAGYSCQQLRQELNLVNTKMSEISDQQVQNRIVGGAMSMMGYGVADAPTDENQLPGLKRRQDRLQHDLIAKNCYAAP